jgi:hypothetical protein
VRGVWEIVKHKFIAPLTVPCKGLPLYLLDCDTTGLQKLAVESCRGGGAGE